MQTKAGRLTGRQTRFSWLITCIHEDSIELAKMGKLMLAIEAGRLSQLQGKSLDEITIDDIQVEIEYDWQFTICFLSSASATSD
jgi:hypothetical protein